MPEINNLYKEERFQGLKIIVLWSCCFGPVVAQYITVEGVIETPFLHSHQETKKGKRERAFKSTPLIT